MADLKGTVDDEARLKKVVQFDATVTLQHIGTELLHFSRTLGVQGEFRIDQATGIPEDFKIITVSDFSEGEAQAKDAELIGTLTALTAFFSGQEYVNAEKIWRHPNTCVEIIFTPSTKTKKFAPNASTPVQTELRTKKEPRTVVPAKFKEAKERPRDGNGTVSPREDLSQLDRPATFTYQAPATKVQHSGFRVKAVSRAGVAEQRDGEWELVDGALRLQIVHRIQADPPVRSNIGQAQFDGAVQFEVPLKPHAEGWFRGEIDVVRPMVVRHVRPAAHPCSGSGSQLEHWLVTAHVDPKSESMNVQFGYTTSNEQASWKCTGPAGTFTDELYVDLPGNLESLQMPVKTGTTKNISGRYNEFVESLSMTVVEGIEEQSR